jgi:Flp pilus assembly protein TadD
MIYYYELDNHEKAIEYLNKALEIKSNIIEAWNCLGIIYDDLGEVKKARRHFRRADELQKKTE